MEGAPPRSPIRTAKNVVVCFSVEAFYIISISASFSSAQFNRAQLSLEQFPPLASVAPGTNSQIFPSLAFSAMKQIHLETEMARYDCDSLTLKDSKTFTESLLTKVNTIFLFIQSPKQRTASSGKSVEPTRQATNKHSHIDFNTFPPHKLN